MVRRTNAMTMPQKTSDSGTPLSSVLRRPGSFFLSAASTFARASASGSRSWAITAFAPATMPPGMSPARKAGRIVWVMMTLDKASVSTGVRP
jgi:hypothetical protein